jgi:hypothetical protein
MKLFIPIIIALLFYPESSSGQMKNSGNMRMHAGSNLALFGDLSNNGNFTNNLGTLHVVGSKPQTFSGSNAIHVNNFIINKSSNALQLDNVLQIINILTFSNGSIYTDPADISDKFVEFLDDASYTGEGNNSHIDGVVRKTGNDAFVFPTGNSTILRKIAMSAPSDVNDHFTAYYADEDPGVLYSTSSLSSGLDHISSCEYWVLNRTNGVSNVAVTLSWDSNSCGIDNLCALQVSRWDGAQWTSEGNGGVTGDMSSGSVVSGANCSNPMSVTSFSPFAFGSTSGANPLPITLIAFEAYVCETSVCLNWQTASELNNDFFTIEKSADGFNWEKLKDIKGAGNSQTILNYNTIDNSPFSGLSYYRLKQTDFNGEFEYSAIEPVKFKNKTVPRLILYPNPTRDNITIEGLPSGLQFIKIYNSFGQEVSSFEKVIQNGELTIQLNTSFLKPGVYYIKTNNNYSSFIKH